MRRFFVLDERTVGEILDTERIYLMRELAERPADDDVGRANLLGKLSQNGYLRQRLFDSRRMVQSSGLPA